MLPCSHVLMFSCSHASSHAPMLSGKVLVTRPAPRIIEDSLHMYLMHIIHTLTSVRSLVALPTPYTPYQHYHDVLLRSKVTMTAVPCQCLPTFPLTRPYGASQSQITPSHCGPPFSNLSIPLFNLLRPASVRPFHTYLIAPSIVGLFVLPHLY